MKKILRNTIINDFWTVLSSSPEGKVVRRERYEAHRKPSAAMNNFKNFFSESGFAYR